LNEGRLRDHLADLLVHKLGWTERIDASVPGTELSDGTALRDGILRDRLLDAVRRINPGPDGEPWLDERRLVQIWDAVTRPISQDLIRGNQEFFEILHAGVAVPGPAGASGRAQVVRLIDWDRPEGNDLLVATGVPVRRPADGGLPDVELDVVLFVNGIPFVVGACASTWQTDGTRGALDLLRTYTGQRRLVPARSIPGLFRFVQLLVAADTERARLGTITSLPEHFAEWKTTEPVAEDLVAVELEADRPLTTLQKLLAGVLRPAHLIDLVHSFSVFHQVDGRTVRLVARHQQFRAVHKMVLRLAEGRTPRSRGGVLWHTQGSGKSLTMVFLIRKVRNTGDLQAFKIVIVSDRRDLRRQLTPVLRLSGEEPQVADSSATARSLLAATAPGVVQLMIQQARRDDFARERQWFGLAAEPDDVTLDLPVLNDSEQILLLIDEAHRTQTGWLHDTLIKAVPNAAKIGLTGTPIIRSRRATTTEIFGAEIDRYTLRESEEDEATVPIRYEGRHDPALLVDRVALDTAYEAETGGAEAVVGLRAALESADLVADKARDMLAHWVRNVLRRGFKAQVVAVSRRATVRYRQALLAAREALVQATEDHQVFGGSHGGFEVEVLAVAALHLPLLRAIDFVPVISGGAGDSDRPELLEWTNSAAQEDRIGRFLAPFPRMEERQVPEAHPAEPHDDPWQGAPQPAQPPIVPGGDDPWSSPWSGQPPETAWGGDPSAPSDPPPIAFLIVQRMLLTGFDAPLEQVLYIDRPIREAELLQAIARTNRPARNKPYGLVVDYVALTDNLDAALAEYDLKDLEGMREGLIEHEMPLLEEHAAAVRDLLSSLDIAGTGAADERERLLELLEDRATRERFDMVTNAFLSRLERLLPRPEVSEFLDLARTVGFVQWRARRRFRDTGTGRPDPNQYGPLLRDLLDRHIRASGALQQVPPVEITDPGFRENIDRLRSDRARARELEYALRQHFEVYRAGDPRRMDRLSDRLDDLLRRLDGAWEELARELRSLVDETLTADSKIKVLGLDPDTEGPIFSTLEQMLAQELGESKPDIQLVVDIARELTALIGVQVSPPQFLESAHLQENLRKDLRKQISTRAGIPRRSAGPIAQEIMSIVLSRRDHFR
jgi:type I restriction enzyme R subunit